MGVLLLGSAAQDTSWSTALGDGFVGIRPIGRNATAPTATGVRTYRMLIPKYCLNYSGGDHVRVTLGPGVYNKVYIGHAAASGDAYDFAATPTQLFFSGSAGVTVTAGNQALSDSAAFVIDPTKNIIVSLYFPGATDAYGISAHTVAGAQLYTIAADDAATVNATGYGTSAATNTLFAVKKIESQSATAIDYSLPSQTTVNATPKEYSTTGSMSAGSNQLVVASNPGFQVNDYLIVEIGGEAGAGLRGTVGVGNVWPKTLYADKAAADAAGNIFSATTEQGIFCRINGGDNLQWYNSQWNVIPNDGNTLTQNYYQRKWVPLSLIAKITAIAGTTLTLDKSSAVATTNANVYFDNVLSPGTGIVAGAGTNQRCLLPAGTFAFSEAWWGMYAQTNATLQGAGKNLTTIFSPKGVPSQAIHLEDCVRCSVKDLHVLGNTRAEGIGFLLNPSGVWPNTTVPDNLIDTGYVLGGIFWNRGIDCETRSCKQTDCTQKAIGGSTCINVWSYDCETIKTEADQCYIQWQWVLSNSIGGGFVDCTIDCAYLTKVGEVSFLSSGVSMIRCGGRNAIWSCNSSGNFLFEDCYTTIEAMSQLSTTSINSQEPIFNINTNQDPGYLDIYMGGDIINPTIITEGYINANQDYMRGITVDTNNVNVRVIGTYPDTPSPKGYIQHPNFVSGKLGGQGSGISANPAITVFGIRVVGTADGSPWGNIHVGGGTVGNCVADAIFGGTQTNNQDNATWVAGHP